MDLRMQISLIRWSGYTDIRSFEKVDGMDKTATKVDGIDITALRTQQMP